MKNQDIERVLVDYINDDKYNLSILINGEWGSGKTFFIKNFNQKELTLQKMANF